MLIAATELMCHAPIGPTKPLPCEDAFLVALQMRAYPAHEECMIREAPVRGGTTSFYDLTTNLIAFLEYPCHPLFFYLSVAALDLLAREMGMNPLDMLQFELGVSVDDPIMRHLTAALLPALKKPAEASKLFVDYITMAVGAHLVQKYGS